LTDSAPGLVRVIGASLESASDRLAKLSKTQWQLQTMSLRHFDAAEYAASFSHDSQEGFGVLFTVPNVTFVVFFSANSAESVCRAFMGRAFSANSERNAIAEIANIVVNAVADAIADATQDMLLLSAPRVVEGGRSDVMLRALDSFRLGGRPSPVVSQIHMTAESLSADCVVILLMSSELRARLESSTKRPPA
jgi:chemotaxis protein CheY-P-specific phosphatase CheC